MNEPSSRRIRLVVEYRGTDFVGWQIQPNGPSVQQALQDALAVLVGHPVQVRGSGRTDAGVHALGQVAAFDTTSALPTRRVRDGLNGLLPPDVACVSADEVRADFDPRRDQKRKTYRYTWLDRRARSPLRDDRVWHVRHGRLDDAAMHEAVQALVGTHAFDSFRAVGCAARHTTRTLEAARVVRDGDLVHLELVGTGFLRHMVRIVAGTLLEVGQGNEPVSHLQAVLSARHREAAGRTAPAQGLTLVDVVYEDEGATYSSSSS